MAALPTIQESINIGDATVFLMGNDYAAGSLWGQRLTKQTSAVLVNYVTSAIEWQLDSLPNDDTLRGAANYLIWLCGKYGLEALSLNTGGSVIPIDPSVTTPNRVDFYVSGSSLIPTGGSTYTFTQFRGYNVSFYRNGLEQATVNDGSSTYFSFNKLTGDFECFGIAAEGELFSIVP